MKTTEKEFKVVDAYYVSVNLKKQVYTVDNRNISISECSTLKSITKSYNVISDDVIRVFIQKTNKISDKHQAISLAKKISCKIIKEKIEDLTLKLQALEFYG